MVKLQFTGWRHVIDSGVYIINNKFYIGSSKNLNLRWKKHRGELRSDNHGNVRLQKAWFSYGEDAFKFEALEMVDSSNSLE